MFLNDVKTLLGVSDSSRDDLFELLIENAQAQVLRRLKAIEPTPVAVPEELRFIIPELVVIRFNKIGSEGMTAESVEGHSVTYSENDLLAYESEIQDYIDSIKGRKKGVVRFL